MTDDWHTIKLEQHDGEIAALTKRLGVLEQDCQELANHVSALIRQMVKLAAPQVIISTANSEWVRDKGVTVTGIAAEWPGTPTTSGAQARR